MPIVPIDKALAILSAVTDEQIEELPPAERRRLCDACLAMAVRCTPVADLPRSGVLKDLKESGGVH
jgi:hypothetical protein